MPHKCPWHEKCVKNNRSKKINVSTLQNWNCICIRCSLRKWWASGVGKFWPFPPGLRRPKRNRVVFFSPILRYHFQEEASITKHWGTVYIKFSCRCQNSRARVNTGRGRPGGRRPSLRVDLSPVMPSCSELGERGRFCQGSEGSFLERDAGGPIQRLRRSTRTLCYQRREGHGVARGTGIISL